MNNITIPYHLAIPSIVCIIGLILIIFFRKKLFKTNSALWIAITVFLVLYLFVVGGATYEDICLQFEANRLDLNKDGVYDISEQTNELQKVMGKLTNDVGRNFSFISGFVFAFIISSVVYVFGRLFQYFKNRKSSQISIKR